MVRKVVFFLFLTTVPVFMPAAWGADFFEPPVTIVPAGPFTAGTTATEKAIYRHMSIGETAAHTIQLATFAIGIYEVTHQEYACFIEDRGYFRPELWSDEGWAIRLKYDWKLPRRWGDHMYFGKNGDFLPVSGLSWYEAQAYCRWISIKTLKSFRLPTEWEWEKAARGTDARIFPWGNEWDVHKCNWYGYLGEVVSDTRDLDPYMYLSPVGSFEDGKSPYGCYDMAGNVLEWCEDTWQGGDPTYRVLRGGCYFSNNFRLMRCAWRGGSYPEIGHVHLGIIGFRVAMDTNG